MGESNPGIIIFEGIIITAGLSSIKAGGEAQRILRYLNIPHIAGVEQTKDLRQAISKQAGVVLTLQRRSLVLAVFPSQNGDEHAVADG